MNYNNLTIHQRISLKGLIHSESERRRILSHKVNHKGLDGLKAIWLLSNFKQAVEFFLTDLGVYKSN